MNDIIKYLQFFATGFVKLFCAFITTFMTYLCFIVGTKIHFIISLILLIWICIIIGEES